MIVESYSCSILKTFMLLIHVRFNIETQEHIKLLNQLLSDNSGKFLLIKNFIRSIKTCLSYHLTTKLSETNFSSFKFAFMPNKSRSVTSTFSLSENSLFFHQADNLHAIN